MGAEWIINIQGEWKSTNAEREEEKRSRKCIYRVPKYMKDLNSNAYTPQVISFGPYHHCDGEQLKLMEPAKRRILKQYLDEVGKTLETVVSAMKKEARALMDAYDGLEEPWTDEDRFLELMILDGCCLLQFLLYEGNFSYCIDQQLRRLCGAKVTADVLLLENQLPLRVLQILLDIGGGKIRAVDALQLVDGFLPGNGIYTLGDIPKIGCHILDVFRSTALGVGDFVYDGQGDVKVATLAELADFGVRLSAAGGLRSIAFQGGVLRLPYIPLDILTQPLLLNFVAFEHIYGLHTYVLWFLTFMDRLIFDSRSGDDELLQRSMALLEKREIIRGLTGSYADLAAWLHGTVKEHLLLRRGILPKSKGVSTVDKELIQYCNKKLPRFRAFCIRADRAYRGWLYKSILATFSLILLHILFPEVTIEKL